jgi:hypothetical protein
MVRSVFVFAVLASIPMTLCSQIAAMFATHTLLVMPIDLAPGSEPARHQILSLPSVQRTNSEDHS